MVIRAFCRLAHPLTQLTEGGMARQIGAQNQGIDKKADQRLDFAPIAVGDWGGDNNIFTATIT